MPIVGNVDAVTATFIAGWLADSENPSQPLDVSIYIDGAGRARVTAECFREDLRTAFPGATGHHAFRYDFPVPLSPFRQHDVEIIDSLTRHPLPNGQITLPSLGRKQTLAPNPICITSTGRSGTSLLMGRLAAHPNIAVAGSHPFEIKQLTYYVMALRTLSLPANWERSVSPDGLAPDATVYSIGFNPFHAPQFGVDPRLKEYWQNTAPNLMIDAFREAVLRYYDVIRAISGKEKICYFAEKAHPNQMIRDGVRVMFGDVREIMLVRDPRDLVCSYRSFWGSNPADAVSLIRSQFAELAKRIKDITPDTLLVRYEELVMSPAATLQRICDFLGINHQTIDRGGDEAVIFQRHGTSGSPHESIGRWRHDLNAAEIAACESGFADLLPIFGYEKM